jgi:hypothetical protein
MGEPTPPGGQNPDSTPTADHERLLQFSQAEKRLLIITIIGTVAGTLIAVLTVGLALFVIHQARTPSEAPLSYVFLTISGPIGFTCFWLLWRSSSKENKFYRGAVLLFLVCNGLGVVLASLVWVGLAAGISK